MKNKLLILSSLFLLTGCNNVESTSTLSTSTLPSVTSTSIVTSKSKEDEIIKTITTYKREDIKSFHVYVGQLEVQTVYMDHCFEFQATIIEYNYHIHSIDLDYVDTSSKSYNYTFCGENYSYYYTK